MTNWAGTSKKGLQELQSSCVNWASKMNVSLPPHVMESLPPIFPGRIKGKERKGKERKGKERKGKERKGKERKGKERKGKERKGKE